MSKLKLKIEAIKMRKEGYSYSDINRTIRVSKSSLSLWLKGVPYRPNNRVLERLEKARQLSSLARTKIRLDTEDEAKKLAADDIGNKLSKRDLFLLGLGLYMGEGSKTVLVRIVNSDPKIILLGMLWLKNVYGLQNNNFSIRIHLYPDSDVDLAKSFWSNLTGLPASQFHKTSIDQRINKSRNNKGKLPYGTAHLTVKSNGNRKFGVLLRKRILESIEQVVQKAGMV